MGGKVHDHDRVSLELVTLDVLFFLLPLFHSLSLSLFFLLIESLSIFSFLPAGREMERKKEKRKRERERKEMKVGSKLILQSILINSGNLSLSLFPFLSLSSLSLFSHSICEEREMWDQQRGYK